MDVTELTAKYTVNHRLQALAGYYTIDETEEFTGDIGTQVTPDVKEYEGYVTPATQTVTIKADGSTVVNYYYTRTKVSLDIDGEYISEHYLNTDGLCTFDVYINDKSVADDVTDFFSDSILFGSTWEVKDINPASGKHYSGSDIKTEKK